MKRILIIAAGLLVAGIATAPAANATRGTAHLKVTVCHNVDHNPHPVTVSVNAVGKLQGGHGLLNLETLAFTPHTGTGGHEHDFLLAVNGVAVVGAPSCSKKEETTTTTQPQTTTTTLPPVTVTTMPTTTTALPEVPHNVCLINGFEVKTNEACPSLTPAPGPGPSVSAPSVTQPAPVVAGKVVAPKATPLAGELPHTGLSDLLLVLGFSLFCIGGSLLAVEKLLRKVPSPRDLR